MYFHFTETPKSIPCSVAKTRHWYNFVDEDRTKRVGILSDEIRTPSVLPSSERIKTAQLPFPPILTPLPLLTIIIGMEILEEDLRMSLKNGFT